jgi:cytosine/adenosine deaminase-related metal-dependent hydrolase
MQINNVRLIDGDIVNIGIAGGKINSVSKFHHHTEPFQLQFDNVIAFPGLINSHDHLDFNLFPQLGNKTYTNYKQWGKYIHENYKEEIDKVLKIPESLRTSWGIYKNLLCGVTTVINHGKRLEILNPLITVIQELQNLHSVKFEKYWKLKLNNPLKKNTPCVIHAGEGTDNNAEKEIDEIIKWNFLKRDLVAIHGVAMNSKQATDFKALVWCPASNYFLLNKTAAVDRLKKNTKICLGTDSTLTANWNIWEHIRVAKESAAGNGLFEMITSTPAKIWNLNSGFIAEGKDADIVVAKARDNFNCSFYCIDPEDILLVIHNGNIRMFDEQLYPQLEAANFNFIHFFKIEINKVTKYVEGNLPKLISLIKVYYPEAILPVDILAH